MLKTQSMTYGHKPASTSIHLLDNDQISFPSFSTNAVRTIGSLSPLVIHDPIYGDQTITEPELIRLIETSTMKRLHSVYQHGITALLSLSPCPAEPVTRCVCLSCRRNARSYPASYQHSLGAMLCVRVCGNGSVEAQAAALLHDVAHTSLSHVCPLFS